MTTLTSDLHIHADNLIAETTAVTTIAGASDTIAKARNTLYPLLGPLARLLRIDGQGAPTSIDPSSRAMQDLRALNGHLETAHNALNDALRVIQRREE